MLGQPAEEGVGVTSAVRVRFRIVPIRNDAPVDQEAGESCNRRLDCVASGKCTGHRAG